MVSWIKAILRPHDQLVISKRASFEFPITTAITMDQIWFAMNQFIHETVIPNIPTTMKKISLMSELFLMT
jgi:hypothetical protein